MNENLKQAAANPLTNWSFETLTILQSKAKQEKKTSASKTSAEANKRDYFHQGALWI